MKALWSAENETGTQFRLGSILDRIKIARKRGQGRFRDYVWDRLCWRFYPQFHYVSEFPLNIDIEASSRCNLKCTHCFRQYMNIGEQQDMNFWLFVKIAQECGDNGLHTMKFSMRGEPLINPDIIRMIIYAKQSGIREVWLNTNGVNLTDKMAFRLIGSGLDWLTVSFDGLDKTYESIRRSAKYIEQLNKLRGFRFIRDTYGKQKPILNVQTLWSAIQGNPDEYYKVMSFADGVSVNPDMHFNNLDLIPDPDFCCPRLWQRLAITSKGDVLRCPSDFQKEDVLGNVNSQSIKEIWHGERMNELRDLHKNKRRLEDPICRKCHHGSQKIPIAVRVRGRESKVLVHEYQTT